jgi:hypothetical protein
VLPVKLSQKVALSLLLLSVSLIAADKAKARSAPLNGFGLRDATPVYLKTARDLSSATTKRGDLLALIVEREVRISGVLLVAEGAKATATVVDVHPRGRAGRGGLLNVRIDSVELVNGQKVQLRAIKTLDGSRRGEFGELMALSLLDWEGFLYWPILPFLHGNDVDLPGGTMVVAYVAGNHPLKPADFQLPLLQISATPEDASVEIDGRLIGTTPLARVVTIGDHTVKMTAPGRQVWQRELSVVGGTISISAELKELPPEIL